MHTLDLLENPESLKRKEQRTFFKCNPETMESKKARKNEVRKKCSRRIENILSLSSFTSGSNHLDIDISVFHSKYFYFLIKRSEYDGQHMR